MADPISIGLIATAVGAGITAYGQYQGGQAKQAMYNYQGGVANVVSGGLQTRANILEAEGGRKAEQAGFVGAANIARSTVRAGAGNVAIGSGSTAGVIGSQTAIARSAQDTARYDAAQAAYGERFQAAEETASAGVYKMAAQEAPIAGDIGALGSIASGAGSVAGKWYDASKVGSSPTIGG